MPLANSAIGDIVATTLENRSKQIADNVTKHNAILKAITEAGNNELSGGYEVRETISYAENANGGSYSGLDLLPTGAQEGFTAAQFTLKQYAVPIVFAGTETLQNAGPQAVHNLIKERVKLAESSMNNLLNRHIYLDGTGNNGKNITGLGAAVSSSPATGVYGGIDRAANSFWRNQKYNAVGDGGGVATASTILTQWNRFFLSMLRGTDRPTMIVAAPDVFSIYQASLQNMQRVMDADKASAGFKALEFQGVPVIFEPTIAGISNGTAYFLNTKFLKWRTHVNRNMVMLDDKQSTNQDATVKTLAWAGNLTCSNSSLQGIYLNS